MNLAILDRDFQGVKRNIHDEAIILYSGGTTGDPKGIVLSNLNFNALAMQLQMAIGTKLAKPGGSNLAILPIFHGFGLGVSIHTGLYIGIKIAQPPTLDLKMPKTEIRKFYL